MIWIIPDHNHAANQDQITTTIFLNLSLLIEEKKFYFFVL